MKKEKFLLHGFSFILIFTLLYKPALPQDGGWDRQMLGVDHLTSVSAISPMIAIASVGYYSPGLMRTFINFIKRLTEERIGLF